MKKIFVLLTMMLMTLGIMAQNNTISYQAVVRDANNRLAANQPVSVTIEVLNASDVSVYSETESVTSNANGLISLTVGDGNPTDFANINWTGAKFKTTVTVTSTGYEVTNTIPVTSVPLSIYASDVNPSGSTITTVYDKIKADSTTLVNRIVTDSTALHTALIDTASNIRTSMATMNTTLQNGINQNKNAIIDTASNIRSSMATMNTNLQNGINQNKNAIIDTAANIRTSMTTMNTTLQNGINQNKNAIIDTAANIRTSMTTMNTTLQNGIDQNKNAIIDTAANIRTGISAVDAKFADYTKTTDLPTTIAGQLHDTANNVRGQLADTANVLRGLINNVSDNLAKEHVYKTSAGTGQTTFYLASEPSTNYLVKMFINGVLVGDNYSSYAVITVSGTTATYHPDRNNGYALQAGDKVFIYYFY